MDALPGTRATMRNAEVAQSPMTLSSFNKGPVRKQRIFSKKVTSNCVPKALNSDTTPNFSLNDLQTNGRGTAKNQGDIGSLSALENLQQIGCVATQVTGDIGSLSALTEPLLLVLSV